MCKQHIPITVYDCGGTQQYCRECGKPLSRWEQTREPKRHPKKEKTKDKDEQSTTTQI